jgi:hypothetical protein
VRRGFERYLARDYEGAFLRYRHAAALGFEVGAANAAYLLHRGLVGRHAEQQRLAFLLLRHSHERTGGSADSALALAGFFARGAGGARRDVLAAAALYARASAAGSPEAAFCLAALLEGGSDGGGGGSGGDSVALLSPNAARAEVLYRRALALATTPAARLVARLALLRLAALRELRAFGLMAPAAPGQTQAGPPRGLLWRAASTAGVRLFAAALDDVAVNAAHESGGGEGGRRAAMLALALAIALFGVFVVEVLRRREGERGREVRAAEN